MIHFAKKPESLNCYRTIPRFRSTRHIDFTMSNAVEKFRGWLCSFDTPKTVRIHSKCIGTLYRLFQLVVAVVLLVCLMILPKKYQVFENVESAVHTQVKGVLYTNYSRQHIRGISNRVWDVADYVIPPQDNGAFFVMTNMIVTPNQIQGRCDEDPKTKSAICSDDVDCPKGEPVKHGYGVRTGRCVNSTRAASLMVCEVYAWCPVENNVLPIKNEAVLKGSRNFTVLIKNQIAFPRFNFKRRNILETQNKDYLHSCRYNPDHPEDSLCPIFRLQTIIEEAGEDYDEMAVQGGVIAITIQWDCNLDFGLEYCKPKYTFRRLDRRHAKIAKGWKFRYANYYDEKGVQTRDLIKAYGILFQVKVTGKAGKADGTAVLLTIGSLIPLFFGVEFFFSCFVLYLHKGSTHFNTKKYAHMHEGKISRQPLTWATPVMQLTKEIPPRTESRCVGGFGVLKELHQQYASAFMLK
ncbi:P2X purinoceptor 4 [Lamellibrachia satsuma]|nr:P2X purinoceptor 4 [Lamellibrachia satsuma]